jgi:hypothetical protein
LVRDATSPLSHARSNPPPPTPFPAPPAPPATPRTHHLPHTPGPPTTRTQCTASHHHQSVCGVCFSRACVCNVCFGGDPARSGSVLCGTSHLPRGCWRRLRHVFSIAWFSSVITVTAEDGVGWGAPLFCATHGHPLSSPATHRFASGGTSCCLWLMPALYSCKPLPFWSAHGLACSRGVVTCTP